MKTHYFVLPILTVCLLLGSGCSKQLDIKPTQEFTADSAYKDLLGYKQGLAKVYGAIAMTGNAGPAGDQDIQNLDEGTSDFIRLFWKAQELSTDEAVVGWNDGTIQDIHLMKWTASNEFLAGLYNRVFFHVTLCNEFMRQSKPGVVGSRLKNPAEAAEVAFFRAEARFLRAFQYWVAMDVFGNPPFMDESFAVGGTAPSQIQRAALFDHVEKELLAVQNELKDPRANEYGRADKAAAWALLARLYLNAGTYKPGENRYADAITYSKKVIDAGYSLETKYQDLFLADNNLRRNEIILTINYDGIRTRGYGGTTFIVNASVGSGIDKPKYGLVSGGWGGIRTTEQIVDLFPTDGSDKRMLFEGSKKQVDVIPDKFTDGLAGGKFKNVTSLGARGKDNAGTFVDTDFPLFRLAEMYLIYAEATLRGGAGGDQALALEYINKLRFRAYNNTIDGNVASIDLDFILAERARELHWECFRRTDLIRFNKFTTGDYVWAWKGGSRNGNAVADFRNLYAIPSSDLSANPKLKQNPGY